MNPELLIWLFPAIFMIHEFEEMIFRKSWLQKNKTYILNRFPKRGAKFIQRQEALSNEAFTFIVAEEFLIVSGISTLAAISDSFELFVGLLTAYTLHLLIHIGQSIILRRYTPAIVTSILTGIYSVSVMIYFIEYLQLYLYATLIFAVIFTAGLVLNLRFMHTITGKIKILNS